MCCVKGDVKVTKPSQANFGFGAKLNGLETAYLT